jgi:E3 ubiquitin-protein ligase RNF5
LLVLQHLPCLLLLLRPGQGYVEALTPEQQHQAFLSRLLLMLGSFVIMCLLLF